MLIKTKKHNADGLVKLETSGNLKEVIINEDLMKPEKASVALCFRGKNSSGIICLSLNDIRMLTKHVAPQLATMQNVKVLKFEKEKTKSGKAK